MHRSLDLGQHGYLTEALGVRLAESFSGFARSTYGWEVAPEQVRPLADVVAGLTAAIQFFSAPGAPVILPTPAYMPFLVVPPWMGRDVIEVPMARDGDRYGYDLDALDAAYAAGGSLLVLCNPHNPIGRVLAARGDARRRRGGRAARRPGVLRRDPRSARVRRASAHVPYASLSEATAAHTVTAVSASKAWNLPGLKCAQLVLSNDADAERWSEVGFMAEHGASNLGVVANTAAYAEGGPWLADVLAYLDGNRRLLGDLLAAPDPGDRLHAAGGHLPRLAGLPCARARRPPRGVLPRARRRSR